MTPEQIAKDAVVKFEEGNCSHKDEWAMGYCFACWVNYWGGAIQRAVAEEKAQKERFREAALNTADLVDARDQALSEKDATIEGLVKALWTANEWAANFPLQTPIDGLYPSVADSEAAEHVYDVTSAALARQPKESGK